MKSIRTRRFRGALLTASVFSALFLVLIAAFGKQLVPQYFSILLGAVFFVLILATASFLAICFAPYFRHEKRWFAIPAMLTVLFFISAVWIWRLPLDMGVLI